MKSCSIKVLMARKNQVALEVLTTAVTVREDPTQVMVANVTRILAKLVRTLRSEGNEKITHHVFRTATGSTTYVGMDAVQTELEKSSLVTKRISDRCKNGRRGSIVKTDYNEHGFNYSRMTAQDARAVYSANKDSKVLRRFIKPIQICSTMDADKAAAVKIAAQQYIKCEIVKLAFTGGQFSENDRALWKIDGKGGAGNGTGIGPFVIAYACIVHNPSADVDDRYPNASLWSRTLPVNGLIFKIDIKKGGVHYMDAAVAAAAAPDDYRDEEDVNNEEEDDDKNRDYERTTKSKGRSGDW
jgi:hypothetical protein